MRFLRRVVRWLKEGRSGWLWLLALASSLSFPLVLGEYSKAEVFERNIRIYGMCLQLFGFFLVLAGIEGSLKHLGSSTVLRRVLSYLAAFPFKQKNKVIEGECFVSANSFGRGRARLSLGPDATFERRLEILENQYISLFDEVGKISGQMDQNERECKRQLKELEHSISEKTYEIRTRYDNFIEGSAVYEFVGVWFFIVGVVCATASVELTYFVLGN